MKYALLIYSENSDEEPTPEQIGAVMAAYGAFTADIDARGINRGGEALDSVDTATTVRVRDGEVMTSDGPFAETKEQLGGFYMIDVEDLDEALAVAAKLPGAAYGSVEVRPVYDWEAAGEAMGIEQ